MKQKHLVIGILAHVDAGKTTLSEALLFESGVIRKMGRVDHQDAFLDTFAMEKERGITIYSKQAVFPMGNTSVTLLDTPGHADFSPEMERALRVLDMALLVISAPDGVTGQAQTLWRLLNLYRIPTVIFVNKMDQPGMDRASVIASLHSDLDERCIDFTDGCETADVQENLALCKEEYLNRYLEGELITEQDVREMVRSRMVFPCFFGSALHRDGTGYLLRNLEILATVPAYEESPFGAAVYKISRDEQGNRMTWMKITSGCLRVKDLVSGEKNGERWEEKADQIRIYSGSGYTQIPYAEAGQVCAVTGLSKTLAGEGLGCEKSRSGGVLEPVLSYRLILPSGTSRAEALKILRIVEEEEPMLRVSCVEQTGEILVRVMGNVQMEILRRLLADRFSLNAEFGEGTVVYRETIAAPVEGVGHFEPLRHYAEVHLLMEPGDPGSGLVFASDCREDVLDRNWQRLILTNLAEKKHKGVLTGSEITDMKITVTGGRAHVKHTEGGDFRQAVYRAVRQGLMSAQNILLEPVYSLRAELPQNSAGRLMNDIRRMGGEAVLTSVDDGISVVEGSAPAAAVGNYQEELSSYTKGRGRMFCTLKGYEPCRNADEVIERIGYDPDLDEENPSWSVFCSHGSGTAVPWYLVREYLHVTPAKREALLESVYEDADTYEVSDVWSEKKQQYDAVRKEDWKSRQRQAESSEKELSEIFARTYGTASAEDNRPGWAKRRKEGGREQSADKNAPEVRTPFKSVKKKPADKEYLLVDGYNIIHAWEDFRSLSEVNMDAARDKLADLLSDYSGATGCTLILVFDAYRVKGGTEHTLKYHNIHVVYTREAETADQYIEKTVHEIGRKYHVTVASSDGLEQMIILGEGARRMPASELREEIRLTAAENREAYTEKSSLGSKRYLFDDADSALAGTIDKIRRGET